MVFSQPSLFLPRIQTSSTKVSKSPFISQSTKHHESFKQYKNNINKPKSSDFYNLMWDPHILRGPTFEDFRSQNDPDHSHLTNFKKFWCNESNIFAHDLDGERPKHRIVAPKTKLGGIVRPTTADVKEKKTKSLYGNQEDMEQFLVEQIDDTSFISSEAQSDLTKNWKYSKTIRKSSYCQPKEGMDEQSQVYYRELVPYEEESEPIVKVSISKIMEQSVIEFMEEEELTDLRKQQIMHEIGIGKQIIRHIRLEDRQQVMHQQLTALTEKRAREHMIQNELENRIGSRTYSVAIFRGFIGETMNAMRIDGSLPEIDTAVENKFLPWLNQSIHRELNENIVSRQLVDDLIHASSSIKIESKKSDDREHLLNIVKRISIQGTQEMYFLKPNQWADSSQSESADESNVIEPITPSHEKTILELANADELTDPEINNG